MELATGEGQQQQSSPSPSSSAGALYHNHQMGSDESIDVSSSIGVSGANGNGANGGNANSADAKPMMLNHPGHVEDLLANESGEGDGPRVVAMAAPSPPLSMNHQQHHQHQQPGLSHAVVVDSEHDLIGAETEPKFSLSKFKRPVSV